MTVGIGAQLAVSRRDHSLANVSRRERPHDSAPPLRPDLSRPLIRSARHPNKSIRGVIDALPGRRPCLRELAAPRRWSLADVLVKLAITCPQKSNFAGERRKQKKPQRVVLAAFLFRATSGTRTQDPRFTKAFRPSSASVRPCLRWHVDIHLIAAIFRQCPALPAIVRPIGTTIGTEQPGQAAALTRCPRGLEPRSWRGEPTTRLRCPIPSAKLDRPSA